ncbi:hypothetical protein GALMADRAFT_212084 [Galerina marginata CBS 339.88]|uniref:DNA 3'-5' helicase n=1 Tax=Galerina marginata (strain CBS 339.88) TaxID=685588 RepID=A0A067SUT3_GALM3|nr:hypothetical protein GALMADRAFT_212084 [Galerina marginata CBS 339.88]
MPSCKECNELFNTGEDLLHHSKFKHAVIDFEVFEQSYHVTPDKDDFFHCPCPFHVELTPYDGLNDYIDHLQTIKKWENTKPPEAITYISEHLVDTPTLRANNLAVNARYNLLICVICVAAVHPDQLASHLKDIHQVHRYNSNAPLVAIVNYFNLPSSFPVLPEGKIVQIQGLEIKKGLSCPVCPAAMGTESSMVYHWTNAHKGQPKPKVFSEELVQRFKKDGHSSYFKVVPVRLPVSEEESLRDLLRNLMPDPSVSGSLTDDARNISPWLRATRWHELLVDKKVPELCALAAHPTKLEFPNLQPAIVHLLEGASALIDQTTPLVLMKLNTETISKGISNTPFHKLQEHDEHIKNYCLPIVGLLAMLLRGSPVPLPPDVQAAVDALRTSISNPPPEDSTAAILTVLSSIWKRVWNPTEDHRITDPTILYLALSTLQESGSFQEPKLVTNPIARIKYCMRLFFLERIHAEKKEKYEFGPGVAANHPWFIEKVESTFNDLCALQHLASSIAYATAGLPRVWWLDRKTYKSMLFGGDTLHFHEIQAMISALEDKVKTAWETKVLLGSNLGVQYDMIRDSLANKRPGYSFTTDIRNTSFAYPEQLALAIMQNDLLKQRFVNHHDRKFISWNTVALRLWLVDYADFTLHHLILIHLTAGASSRVTEITAMLLCNTVQYPTRNLVAFGRHIALLVTYLKTSAITGLDKLIPHSLSAFTSDLLIQDLAIARPFARFVASICFPDRPDVLELYNTHLFVNVNKLFNTTDVTETLKKVSAPHLAFQLTVSSWRHISIAWRRVLSPRLPEIIDNSEKDTAEAQQSGHNRGIENKLYGLSSDSLSGAAEDVLPFYLEASTDWQIVCDIVPGGLGIPYRSALMSQFHTLLEQGKITRPPKSEAEGIQMVVERKLAALEDKLDGKLNQILMHLRGLSAPAFTSTSSTTISTPTSQLVDSYSFEQSTKEYLASEALRKLRKLFGADATWTCPEQLQSILAVLMLETDVISVLPTGAGKTMIIAIPALVEESRVSVVLLPLRSILLEYTERFTKLEIAFEIYEYGKPFAGNTNLIFASADAGPTSGFRQAIAELNEKVGVVRYIVDEGHIPYLSTHFRPALKNMADMRCSFPVQVVILSATITPQMEPAVRSFFCMKEETAVIRTKTNRPELCYIWSSRCSHDDVPGLILQHIRDYLTEPDDRALIFVPTLAIGTILQEKTNLPFYHGGLGDEDRVAIQSSWRAGKPTAFIATSAFGTGNDYSRVRLVIHASPPSEMLSYIQEVSRAGRDKAPAMCIMIPFERPRLYPTAPDHEGMQHIQDALSGPPKCIRFLITSFVDVEGTRCADSSENQLCSVCGKMKTASKSKRSALPSFEKPTQQAKKLRQDRNVSQSHYITNFRYQLSKFADGPCASCVVNGVDNPSQHEIIKCNTLKTLALYSPFLDWKKKIKYKGYGFCWFCHVPNVSSNGTLDALHPSTRCDYKDIIAPVAFYVLSNNEMRNQAADHFGVALLSYDHALLWINSPPVEGHLSNLTALFLWFADVFQES